MQIIYKIFRRIKSRYYYLIDYIYYTGRPKYINPIFYLRQNNEQSSINKLKKINHGELYDLILELQKRSGSTGCEFSDYYALYSDLIRLRPKVILECGSGMTSLVIAYYISKMNPKGDYKFISCEENPHYHKQIQNIFPAQYLQFVNFYALKRIEGEINNIKCSYYDNIPKLNYEYIFIDGPTFRADKKQVKRFNSDIVNLLMKNKEIVINGIMDQRILNYRIYKFLFTKKKINYDVIRKIVYLNSLSKKDLKIK